MPRLTTDQRLANIHEEAMTRFDAIQSVMRDERLQCLQDRRFYSIAGAQWEGPLAAQYENKPKFEVNKVHLSVMRIINEQRNNRITVDFVSKEGAEYDALADTCDDLYRADEQDSAAREAYDNAFEEAVGGGFGAYRLTTCWENEEDDDDERQRIKFEPIYDADSSVWFDLDAKRQDKSDARYAFVLSSMTRSRYIEQYDDDPATWPKTVHQYEFDWASPDVVFVAEYYRVEDKSETVSIFESIDGETESYTKADFDEDPELELKLSAIGTVLVREKRVKRRKVSKYILSGASVLEDCGFIAGRNIPIVPIYGKRWFIDNVERCMGHVRLVKDAQRLKNMQLSKLAEISAFSSVEKPIFVPEQVAGHQVMWAEDNLKNYPYMLVNPVTDASGAQQASGPLAFTKSAEIPPALAGILQLTDGDIKDILGNPEQAEQMQPNMSGKAIELIQTKVDLQSFIYMSNFATGVQRGGEIWLSMASEIYVERGRKMKGINAQGEIKSIELSRPNVSETGEVETENDLSGAQFDVVASIGPSSISKRAATVRALTGMIMLASDEETKAVLTSMAMMNMDGEGISDVRSYFRRKLIKAGVLKPDQQEAQEIAQELAGRQPDPQNLYLQAAAEEARAKALEAQSRTERNMADADLIRAKTIETISKTDSEEQSQAFGVIDRLVKAGPPQETMMPPSVVVADIPQQTFAQPPETAQVISELPTGMETP